MSRARRQAVFEPGVMDLIEEAFHLLRRLPVTAWSRLALGTAPYLAGLLYFVADMGRSPYAVDRCAAEALLLSLLYLGSRTGQAAFGRSLWRVLRRDEAEAAQTIGAGRLALQQALLAPVSLVALALSAFMLLPLGWALALHQNTAAMAEPDVRGTWRRALRVTRLWPVQNHLALAVLGFFGLMAWGGAQAGLALLPQLAKMLLGLDSEFTQSAAWASSPFFLLTSWAAAYAAVKPLALAVQVLRAYYGDARITGEDLRANFRAARRPSPLRAALTALMLLGAAAAWGRPRGEAAPPAGGPPAAAVPPAVDAGVFEREAERVLQRTEYQWRLPRDLPRREPRGPFEQLVRDFVDSVRRAREAVQEWWSRLRRTLLDWLEPDGGRRGRGGRAALDWAAVLQGATWILVAIIATAAALLLYRAWRTRARHLVVEAAPAGPAPDLEDERVLASQLPEEDWLRLAEELRRGGEYRKALRACFLAALALFGRLKLVEIARGKSNRDYARELARRARRCPAVLEPFHDNVRRFERAWYGSHPAGDGDVAELLGNFGRIRDLARE